jgi:ankyrin repeat protein
MNKINAKNIKIFLLVSISSVIFNLTFHSVLVYAGVNKAKDELTKTGIDLTYDAFFDQIRKGNLKFVSLFLDAGFNANHVNEELESPIKIAVEKGHNDIVKLLLLKGAYVNTGDCTPLMIAIEKGNTDTVEILLKYSVDIDVNDTGIHNEIALHHACQKQRYEIAEMLIKAGSKLNWPNDHGITPLISAVIENDNIMVKLLLEKGADVNLGDTRDGYLDQTPLMYAASYGYKEIAYILIKNGANVNKKDKNGETALDYAIRNNSNEIISYLETVGVTH